MKVSLDQRVGQELLLDDLELLLREINDFCGSNITRRNEIPRILDDYLLYVAKTGNTVFPWQHIRPLFRWKLQSSIETFTGEPLTMETTVFERFDLFRSAPFTIQRFSELITDPKRHYKVKEKFLFALEKAVYVVSTVEPKSPDESKAEVNGAAENPSGDGTYHELNSTYNIIPTVPENLSMAGDTPTSFPIEVSITQPTEGSDLPIDTVEPIQQSLVEPIITVTVDSDLENKAVEETTLEDATYQELDSTSDVALDVAVALPEEPTAHVTDSPTLELETSTEEAASIEPSVGFVEEKISSESMETVSSTEIHPVEQKEAKPEEAIATLQELPEEEPKSETVPLSLVEGEPAVALVAWEAKAEDEADPEVVTLDTVEQPEPLAQPFNPEKMEVEQNGNINC